MQASEVHTLGARQQAGSLSDHSQFATFPVLWSGTAQGWQPLASGIGIVGEVFGLWEDAQVGQLGGYAALWYGTPASRVDLGLPGAAGSAALAVHGQIQVGWKEVPPNSYHAALWRGTAGSYVDLHPLGAVNSYARATDGVLQGGDAWFPVAGGGQVWHAAIWSGNPQSFVDLSPGERASNVYGMAPGVQVGVANFPGQGGFHAAVWRGTALSFVDFNPPGGSTRFFATTGRIHVGQGGLGSPGSAHALLNFGTPDAWLDLHQFLPPGYNSFSAANSVYQDGDTIYVGGYAVSDATSMHEAFLWIGAVPCYPNCDGSTTAPVQNVADFICFLNRFAAADPYANCDGSTIQPILNVSDFICFMSKFAAGCS